MTTVYLGENDEWLNEKTNLEYQTPQGAIKEIQYSLRPEYGKGLVLKYVDAFAMLTISSFVPKVNIDYRRELKHAFLQMSFLIEGTKIVTPKGKDDIVLESGDGLLFFRDSYQGKSTIHKNSLFKEISIRVTEAFLEENTLMDLVKEYELSKSVSVLPITEDVMVALESVEVKNPRWDLKSIYFRAKILELLTLQLGNVNDGQIAKIKSLNDGKLSCLYNLRKLVKNNLHENFTLFELSMRFGIQQQELNERFIKVFGISIYEFMVTEKMIASKRLLTETTLLIYEIAEKVGYRNGTHFSAAYKRYYGKTPRQYRKSIQ